MPYVYGDLSGSDDSNVLVAACYLGKDEEWQTATEAWHGVLDDAGIRGAFHATDFFSGRKLFAGKEWDPKGDKHREYAARFTAVADDAGLIGFAYGLDLDAFRTLLAPQLAKEDRTQSASHPRTFVTMKVLHRVGEFLAQAGYWQQPRISVVFEQEPGGGRYGNFFEESQRRRERFTSWFQSFTTADKSLVQLQIADLLAHEAWRRAREVLSESPREMRKSFGRMLIRERVELQLMNRVEAASNAVRTRELLARYPKGLIPPEDPFHPARRTQ